MSSPKENTQETKAFEPGTKQVKSKTYVKTGAYADGAEQEPSAGTCGQLCGGTALSGSSSPGLRPGE